MLVTHDNALEDDVWRIDMAFHPHPYGCTGYQEVPAIQVN
jgi:hypothetical protein